MERITELHQALLDHGVPVEQIQHIPLSRDVPPHQQGWQGGVQVYTGLAHSHPKADGSYLVSTAEADRRVAAMGRLTAAQRAAQFLAHSREPGQVCEHCQSANQDAPASRQ